MEVSFINAQGGENGRGGDVDITAGRFFRATESFSDRNDNLASISTAGGQGGGDITIRHGGLGLTPFNVGNLDDNGTAETITSGEFGIRPPQSLPFTTAEGNIQIISVDAPDSRDYEPRPSEPSRVEEPPRTTPTQPSEPLPPAEGTFTNEFIEHLGIGNISPKTLEEAQIDLKRIENETGSKVALIYAFFSPRNLNLDVFNQERILRVIQNDFVGGEEDELQIVLVTSTGQPIVKPLEITRTEVQQAANIFLSDVARQGTTSPKLYQGSGQQFYDWLIAPIEAELDTQTISNLAFVVDAKLRSLPLAALYDQERGFITQRYSIGLVPSFSLIDTEYVSTQDAELLAMGASEFQELDPLPAVPLELSVIRNLLGGVVFLNEPFTPENLRAQREQTPFSVVHSGKRMEKFSVRRIAKLIHSILGKPQNHFRGN
ncbi:MAG: CHAT domain-containing protein [Leptolyngbyaceae cyanobacterium SM1_4_3]|nr:CHAT domain-containing protein [Leptolyngbyaceae cyanobacterium SM1_4_3]